MFTSDELLRHYPCLLAHLRRQVGYDADDLAQETFLRAWGARNRFRAGHLRPWLFTIARRLAVNHATRRRPFISRASPQTVQRPPDEEIISQETAGIVRRAVAKLRDRQRQAVVLFYFEGSRSDEIAARMGLSVQGAKSLLARSRVILRRLLLEMLPDAGIVTNAGQSSG